MSSSTRKRKATRIRQRNRNTASTMQVIERLFNPSVDNTKIFRQRLIQSSTIQSTVTGVVNTVLSLNPNGTSDWSTLATLYDEFRVVGVRLNLLSYQQFSVTSLNGIVGVAFDNDDSVTITSLNAVLEYDTAQIIPAVFSHQASGIENKDSMLRLSWSRPTSGGNTAINWVDVASPGSSLGSIKFYTSTITASTTYFQYVLEYFVEFRGRR